MTTVRADADRDAVLRVVEDAFGPDDLVAAAAREG